LRNCAVLSAAAVPLVPGWVAIWPFSENYNGHLSCYWAGNNIFGRKMRNLILIVAMLVSVTAVAQTRIFRGRVTDEQGTGLAFAVIEAKEQHKGVYTDESGYFTFIGNVAEMKTLAVFCLGFERQELDVANLPQDSVIIRLHPKATTLKTVQITAHQGKRRTGILGRGRRALRHDGELYRNYGAETAIRLKADTGQYEAELKNIYVYITKEGDPETRFRIHVYEWGDLPEREITDSNVIAHARKGGTWVKIDLSDKRIPVGDGLFVSIEWVSGFGNKEIGMQSSYAAEVAGFNGMVPGITDGYGAPSITYTRKPFEKEWTHYDAPDAARKGGYFLNPMIYCTYSYIK